MRSNLKDSSKPGKYYAIPTNRRKMTLRELGDEINKYTHLNNADIVKMLYAFSDVIPRLLADGKIVSLGTLGDLRINFSSVGVDKPENFKKTHIKNVKIHYRPEKEMKESLNSIIFEKAEPK